MIFLEKKIFQDFFTPSTDFNRIFPTPRKLRENEKLSDAFNHLSIAVKRNGNEALGGAISDTIPFVWSANA